MSHRRHVFLLCPPPCPGLASLLSMAALVTSMVRAQPVVPGSGFKIDLVGDDFEDPNWDFFYNHPKSSRNIDEQERGPLAQSKNGRWLEGPHRGTPDIMKRVLTPDGGWNTVSVRC